MPFKRLTFLFFALVSSCSIACSKEALDTLTISDFPEIDLPIITDETDTITIMQWNIGHFSLGKYSRSSVTDINFDSRRLGYLEILNNAGANIVSLNEYSTLFANTSKHPRCFADTLLFKSYHYKAIGNNEKQRRYSLNAIFSTIELLSPLTIDFEVNKSVTLSSSQVFSTDYYYLFSIIKLFNREIVFISTHLAFDNNNERVVMGQIEELINNLKNYPFVIICGDFNTNSTNLFPFIDAGYSIANDGTFLTYPAGNESSSLDNIIVKGLSISSVRTIPTLLSDHLPIVCELSLNEEN